jgi:acyl dehydratase
VAARETPQALCLSDLPEGRQDRHRYHISEDVVAAFLVASRDYSPIHVDETAARSRGFDGRVSHGALLNGFLSHFVGMRLPGASGLLLSVDIRYVSPCHVGDDVDLIGTVAQRSEASGTILLTFQFDNVTRDRTAATGRAVIRVGG